MALSSYQWSLNVCCLVFLISFVSSELVCEDESKSCKKWSQQKKLCDETQKYKTQRYFVSMSRLCKKSCLMCGDDDASLFDKDSRCYSFFKKGYCELKEHQGYMLKKCEYSCRNTLRSGVKPPGRGNFQRNDPPAQQQQGVMNQQQADNIYAQQNGQQYPQQGGQQYPQNYGQQQPQFQNYGQQQPQAQAYSQQQPQAQNQAQNYGQQHDQLQAQNYGQYQHQAQLNGQQQYPQQQAQQNDAQSQQTAGQQVPQAQPQGTQSLSDLPVKVLALSNPNPSRKHKLEKKKKHHQADNNIDDDDSAVNDTDDDDDDDMD